MIRILLIIAFITQISRIDAQLVEWGSTTKKKFAEKPILIIDADSSMYLLKKTRSISNTTFDLSTYGADSIKSVTIIRNDLDKTFTKPIAFSYVNDTIKNLQAKLDPFGGKVTMYNTYFSSDLDSLGKKELMTISDFTIPTFFKPFVATSPDQKFTALLFNIRQRKMIQVYNEHFELVYEYEDTILTEKEGKETPLQIQIDNLGSVTYLYRFNSSSLIDNSYEFVLSHIDSSQSAWSSTIKSDKGAYYDRPYFEKEYNDVTLYVSKSKKKSVDVFSTLSTFQFDKLTGVKKGETNIELPQTVSMMSNLDKPDVIKLKGDFKVKEVVSLGDGRKQLFYEKEEIFDDGTQLFNLKKEILILELSKENTINWSVLLEKFNKGKDESDTKGFKTIRKDDNTYVYYNNGTGNKYRFVQAKLNDSGQVTFADLEDKKSVLGKIIFDMDVIPESNHLFLDSNDIKYKVGVVK